MYIFLISSRWKIHPNALILQHIIMSTLSIGVILFFFSYFLFFIITVKINRWNEANLNYMTKLM